MSGSLNRCDFIGNLGKDPEIRAIQSGDKVATLSLAVSEKWKTKAGEAKERTEWIKVTIWDEMIIGVCERYLKKGAKVYISGAFQTNKWDKDGVTQYSTEIVLNRYKGVLQMLDSREGGHEKPLAAPVDPNKPLDGPMPDLDDNIPFSPCK